MKLAVLFCGDGRRTYLDQAVRAVTANVLHPITARLMINDEAHPAYCGALDLAYPEFAIVHTERQGMAGAVQAGFDLALSHDPDYVLWVEEDMIVTRRLPIREATERLEADPTLAQMLFQRQPISGVETSSGSVIGGLRAHAPNFTEHGSYCAQDFIFSLNPCLIPNAVLRGGYDGGNEAGMTAKLLEQGYRFGVWGHDTDEPYCTHIGAERSPGWRL